MKKLNIKLKQMLLVVLIATTSIMSAQTEFAPIGAEWHYDYQQFATKGYVQITALKDTIINDKTCRVLEKSYHYYDYILETNRDFVFGFEYIAQDGGEIMAYLDSKFYTLFDFDASVGDSWTVHKDNVAGSVMVVGKGEEEVNGMKLRYIELNDISGSECGFGYYGGMPVKVFECVGPTNSYLFPEHTDYVDANEGGLIRCYSDPGFGELKVGDTECDYVYNQVDEHSENTSFFVYPNPASEEIIISTSHYGEMAVEIFNYAGTLVYTSYINGENAKINISTLPAGVYYIVINNDSIGRQTKTVVKN